MPARNSYKIYVEDGYYHIYNRGVNKTAIFEDSADYSRFLSYLKEYLSPKESQELLKSAGADLPLEEKKRLNLELNRNNYSTEIVLMAYCLMPNHFHLFLQQKKSDAIDRFMASLGTRYVMYFNRRHNRVGPLFQGVYRAVLMENEAQYLHISRYIHRQAISESGESETNFPSSFPEYLGSRKTAWVHPEEILSFFSDASPSLSYRAFVTEYSPLYAFPDNAITA